MLTISSNIVSIKFAEKACAFFMPTAAFKPRTLFVALVAAGLLPLSAAPVFAGSFAITGNSTTAQTLGSGAGQTGTVDNGASLTVGGGTVAVTISGSNATLTNLGTINQTGTGRVVRDNTGVTGLMITNGSLSNSTALMQAADADVIQMAKPSASVTLNNYGQMISLNASAGGAQAVDFASITSGSNIVNNYTGALMKAYEADAVRLGVNGVLNNAGTIQSIAALGGGSDAVDLQTNSGAQITNSGLIDGGRHGITGGPADAASLFTASIINQVGGTIQGSNGAGLNFDGFNANQTVTVVNHGTITGNGISGDGDGIDSDGLVNITNTGLIRSINAFSDTTPAQSEGISAGGGTIINSGTIEGLVAPGNSNAVGRGISLLGNDVESGPLAGTREAIYGNAVVTNQAGGVIRGQGDSAIAVDGPASGYTVVINNNAGATIVGGGAGNAAIRTGADNDTINNAGVIDGSANGKAIDMGAGNNTLYVSGGSAVILGDINGGSGGSNTMTVNAGAGNQFNYAGSISNFDKVEIQSGHVSLSGVSGYTGMTTLSGGVLTLDGANRLSAESALTMNGGLLEIANAGGANGQTFLSLSLLENSIIDLGFSSLTFNDLGLISAGKTLTILDYLYDASPDYAFRLLGDFSLDADFLALLSGTTINGHLVSFQFDGQYTDVTVPEPASFALFIIALGLMAGFSRRKTQGMDGFAV